MQVHTRRLVEDYVALSHSIAALLRVLPRKKLVEVSLLVVALQWQILSPDADQSGILPACQKLATLLLAEFTWRRLSEAGYSGALQPLELPQEIAGLRSATSQVIP